MIRSHQVLCTECDRERESLIVQGFTVLGCLPAPGSNDFCIISYEEVQNAFGNPSALAAPLARATAAAVATVMDAQADAVPPPAPIPTATAAANTNASSGLTATQRASCEAIVNIFETGSVRGEYGQVTLIPGDTGRLTYGRSQTTLGSGNLFKL